MKDWTVLTLNKENAQQISEEFNIPLIIAMLLDIRGITDYEKIEEFLSDDCELSDPFLMADMDKAVIRIEHALENGEKICIYGDYDADGVTSTALLYSYLEQRGADVMFYIPSRDSEGYGMNIGAVNKLNEYGVNLIITVDNGISAVEEINYANSLGIDTVVTDHHNVPDIIPEAAAVVNPHRKDCDSFFKELSGVGVVFKLIMALEDCNLDTDKLLSEYSDIASIGTIGDIVSLTGENRIIVKNGINKMKSMSRIGINAILNEASIPADKLSAGRIAFTVVPRINACGRLGLSQKAVKLLLCDDIQLADEMAVELGEDNKERQLIEKEILNSVCKKIEDDALLKTQRIMVICGENWHPGVIGIVASRIKEMYGKPVIIISTDGTVARGSGRSIKGFSLIEAITHCSNLLLHFGGHPMAAGITLDDNKITEFSQMINAYAASKGQMPLPVLEIDCKLNPAILSLDIAEQIKTLEPFGAGNPAPLFGLYNMKLDDIKPTGGGNHLRLTLSRSNKKITAMLFSTALEDFPYEANDILDLAVTIDINEYNGSSYLSTVIRDIKLHTAQMKDMLCSQYNFEALLRNEALDSKSKADLMPNREDFAAVFRFLKKNGGWNYSADMLCCRMGNISYGKLMVVLTAMKELSLIDLYEEVNKIKVTFLPFEGKADLNSAYIMKKLMQL